MQKIKGKVGILVALLVLGIGAAYARPIVNLSLGKTEVKGGQNASNQYTPSIGLGWRERIPSSFWYWQGSLSWMPGNTLGSGSQLVRRDDTLALLGGVQYTTGHLSLLGNVGLVLQKIRNASNTASASASQPAIQLGLGYIVNTHVMIAATYLHSMGKGSPKVSGNSISDVPGLNRFAVQLTLGV